LRCYYSDLVIGGDICFNARRVDSGGRMALSGGVCWILGAIFAVPGIIADAMSVTLGLEPASWLMLWDAVFVVAQIGTLVGWSQCIYMPRAKKPRADHCRS
jgi:UPF0716 family protein affecting phage T7 exclusion